MSKIIFVCYNQGAGGESMAKDISNLSNVYDLVSKAVGTRTVTRDVTKGLSRNDAFKQKQLQSIIDDLPNDKWHVVPTHFKPDQLETLSCEKFYVVIYADNPESREKIEEHKKNKVWNHVFVDPLELKGQIEAHNADPHDPYILSRLKGPVQYGKLWSYINRIDPVSDDLEKEYHIWNTESKPHTTVNLPNAACIEYLDRRSPIFYQNFINDLHKQLTKSI